MKQDVNEVIRPGGEPADLIREHVGKRLHGPVKIGAPRFGIGKCPKSGRERRPDMAQVPNLPVLYDLYFVVPDKTSPERVRVSNEA